MTRHILQRHLHPPQTVAALSSTLGTRPAWIHPHGPLEGVQDFADDVEACLELLEDETGSVDEHVDLRKVRVLVNALSLQTRYLADEINGTSHRLIEKGGA